MSDVGLTLLAYTSSFKYNIKKLAEIEMSKKLMIVAPFVSFPNEGGFNRFITLAELLSEYYEVTLITSRFYHSAKRHRLTKYDNYNFKVILIDEPGYKKNIGLTRLKSHFYFCKELKKYLMLNGKCFDIVYSAYPLIYSNYILGKSKSKFNYKLIMDIQDVWPEAITGPIPALSGKTGSVILKPFAIYANKTYSFADGLVAVSQTYLNRADIKSLSDNNKATVYIGTPYTLLNNKYRPQENTKRRLVAIYLGTLGGSYDLTTVIKAAALCKDDVEIKIVGNGPDLAKLRKLDKSLGGNVDFLGSYPYEEAMQILSRSDIAINAIKSTAQQSITNKLSDYLSYGIPIISSQKNPEVVKILNECGNFTYEAGDYKELARKLIHIGRNKQDLIEISNSNFNFSKNNLFRDNSYRKIINLVNYISDQ